MSLCFFLPSMHISIFFLLTNEAENVFHQNLFPRKTNVDEEIKCDLKERVEMCYPLKYIYFLSALFVISYAWLRSVFVYYRQKSITANKIYLSRAALLLITHCTTPLILSYLPLNTYYLTEKDANKMFELHARSQRPTFLRKYIILF
jgi:hypothetical protein